MFTLLLTLLADSLISRLEHPRYAVRSAAHAALARLGPLARPRLEAARPGHPEAARRVRQLLEPWWEERLDALSRKLKPTSWPRRPWLSLGAAPAALYLTEARVRLRRTGAPDWPEYREATRLWVLSRLRQGRPAQEIVRELDRMAQEERHWIVANGAGYSPPVTLPKEP